MPVVLVVEDDLDIITTLTEILQEEGHEVRQAHDGVQALDAMFQEPKPTVILLDLMMPDLDGWGFMKAKNADAEVRPIPVIVMTAQSGDKARSKGLEGVQLIIHKPFDIDRFLQAVNRILKGVSNGQPGR